MPKNLLINYEKKLPFEELDKHFHSPSTNSNNKKNKNLNTFLKCKKKK